MSSDEISARFERFFYIGNMLQSICHGITLYLAFNSIVLLAKPLCIRTPTLANHGLPGIHIQLPNRLSIKQRIFFIAYVLVMVLCMTFALASNVLFGQQLWIDHRDFKGGPSAYWAHAASSWFNVTGSAMCMFANCMGDLLSAIAPLMIIHRMASGKAWEKDTVQQMSALQGIESFELSSPSPTASDNETLGLDRTDSNVSCIA
ncbi:hypothetical protein PQX77_011856 [Marasmius sp. AFHP31]|nr:hypothetical protein PQX77_011856 [Marasmius sp. AFHP31]